MEGQDEQNQHEARTSSAMTSGRGSELAEQSHVTAPSSNTYDDEPPDDPMLYPVPSIVPVPTGTSSPSIRLFRRFHGFRRTRRTRRYLSHSAPPLTAIIIVAPSSSLPAHFPE